MSSGFPPSLIASVFLGTFGGYFGGLFGGYFGGSLPVKDTENGSPTFLAHPIPLNLGECAEDFFSDCGKPQLPAGDSNLWETMCPLSPSSKTPLYWNTPIRKSIHKVAALFVLPLLISPSLPPCSSLRPLFICFGGDWVSWRIFSKGDGMTSLTQSFLFFPLSDGDAVVFVPEWLSDLVNWLSCLNSYDTVPAPAIEGRKLEMRWKWAFLRNTGLLSSVESTRY